LEPDETVTVFTGKAELGQGILTALAQIAADEFDVGFDKIRMVSADTSRGPDEQYTFGSQSVEQSGSAPFERQARRHAAFFSLRPRGASAPARRICTPRPASSLLRTGSVQPSGKSQAQIPIC
jgi:CO/xanthine dehydrogenase Mo-binding subunit